MTLRVLILADGRPALDQEITVDSHELASNHVPRHVPIPVHPIAKASAQSLERSLARLESWVRRAS